MEDLCLDFTVEHEAYGKRMTQVRGAMLSLLKTPQPRSRQVVMHSICRRFSQRTSPVVGRPRSVYDRPQADSDIS